MTERLHQIINDFGRKRIFVIGDLMADHYILGDANRLSPEAPVPVVDVKNEIFMLGGAANVVNNIVSLGGHAFPLGVIGRDKNGTWLSEEFVRKGIGISGLIVSSDRPTTTKTRVLVGQHQLIRIDHENRNELSNECQNKIIEVLDSEIDEAECVALSDYNKGLFTLDLIARIKSIAKEKRLISIASPKRKNFLEYKDMVVVKSNAEEAYNAANVMSMDDTVANDVGRKLLKKLRCDSFLMTRGKDGMTLFEKTGDILNIPAFSREVYDVTGAGDVVTAVMALSLNSGATFKEASIISNAAAGVKVGKVGTATVDPRELRAQLASFNHVFNNLKR